MSREVAGGTIGRIVAGLFAMLLFVATGANAQTDMKKKYPNMAPIDEYLMNQDAEIAMARTAAPKAISKDATVLVLTGHGYETVIKGTNGFVCMVSCPAPRPFGVRLSGIVGSALVRSLTAARWKNGRTAKGGTNSAAPPLKEWGGYQMRD